MSVRDSKNTLGEAQAITDSAVATTNIFDLGPVGQSGYANGTTAIQVEFVCTEDFAETGTTNTLTFSIRTSATESGGALSGTIVTLLKSADIVAKGTIKTTNRIAFQPTLPPNCLRYIDAYFTPVGTFTAGKISTFLGAPRQSSVA